MTAYVIARITVTAPEDYQSYASQTVALAEKAGGRFLVKGGLQTQIEGNSPERQDLIEYPDHDTALKWYNTPEYQRILPIATSSSERDIVIVDGI